MQSMQRDSYYAKSEQSAYHSYGWQFSCFRLLSFIFNATRTILSSPHPCGIRPVASVTLKGTSHVSLAHDITDMRTPLVHCLFGNPMKPIEEDVMRVSPVTEETLHDVTAILGARAARSLGANVAMADLALGAIAAHYFPESIIDSSVTGNFDLARYRNLGRPLNPEIALFILEALRPGRAPLPRLVSYPRPQDPMAPDVYLYIWSHSWLRIPLSINVGRRGILAQREEVTGVVPSGVQTFGHLFTQHAQHSITSFDSKYPGIHTPSYGQSWQLTMDGTPLFTQALYDGWIWTLANLHWIFWAMTYLPKTSTDVRHYRLWVRHTLAALFVAEGRNVSSTSHAGIAFSRLDANNIVVNSARHWVRAICLESPEEPLDTTSPEALLVDLANKGVIVYARDENEEGNNAMDVDSPTPPTITLQDEWDQSSSYSALEPIAWRVLLSKLDAGIAQYAKDRLFY